MRRVLAVHLGARLRRDDGTSLVEVMVVLGLLTMILAAISATTILGQRTAGSTATRLDQAATARVAVEAVSKTLRTAVLPSQLGGSCSACTSAAFIQGNSRSVFFYGNLDNVNNVRGPSKVSYSINAAGNLIERIQPPDYLPPGNFNYTWVNSAVRTRTLARGIQPGPAMFTYYDETGVLVPTPLDPAALARVDTIELTIQVKSPSGYRVPATTYRQTIALPNHDSVVKP